MNSIGLKKFRRFANFPSIDLGDVTILVGGNNSGKSTIVKALLLCMYNLRNMRINDRRREDGENLFSSGMSSPIFRFNPLDFYDVKIKTFARAIHNRPVAEEVLTSDGDYRTIVGLPTTMTFSFSVGGFAFEIEVAGNKDEQLTYGDVVSITIEDKANAVRYGANYINHRMSFEVLNAQSAEDFDLLRSLFKEFKKVKAQADAAEQSGNLEQIADLTSRLEKITSQINSMCDRDEEGEELTEDELKQLIKTQYRKNNPVAASYYMPLGVNMEVPKEPTVLNVINNIGNYANTKAIPPKEGADYDSFTDYAMAMEAYEHDDEQREAIKLEIDKIRKSYNALSDVLANAGIEYISAHAANQNTLYNTADRNDYIAQTVHDFYNEKIAKGSKYDRFVIEWMTEFEIGSDYKIDTIGGEAYTVDIVNEDGSVVPLADKGMGSIQMMILILRLATIQHQNRRSFWPTSIIIEEPEQNLHPRLQSRLATLFSTIAGPGKFRFVIETHSEYLIRKAQVLVAEANFIDEEDLREHNPFKIYYLPQDDSERYEMKFRTDGSFENDFKEGFFDEAENLAFKIL